MMEKRNFVTSARTPAAGAADIDDILDAGTAGFGRKTTTKVVNAFEKKASAEDEKSDNL
jgi:hypothetical protein